MKLSDEIRRMDIRGVYGYLIYQAEQLEEENTTLKRENEELKDTIRIDWEVIVDAIDDHDIKQAAIRLWNRADALLTAQEPELKLSEQMKVREKQADISDGADSLFITMDRRVWLDYADQVAQLEAEKEELRIEGNRLYGIGQELCAENEVLNRPDDGLIGGSYIEPQPEPFPPDEDIKSS